MTAPSDISAPPPGRSWRNIRQEVKPLAMSRKGRRRQLAAWAKVTALSVFVAGTGWGIYEVAHSWSTDRAALATAVHSELVRAMATPELKALFTRMGAEPGGNSPQEFAAFIERERAKYARIVKLSGAKVD